MRLSVTTGQLLLLCLSRDTYLIFSGVETWPRKLWKPVGFVSDTEVSWSKLRLGNSIKRVWRLHQSSTAVKWIYLARWQQSVNTNIEVLSRFMVLSSRTLQAVLLQFLLCKIIRQLLFCKLTLDFPPGTVIRPNSELMRGVSFCQRARKWNYPS